MNHPTKKLGNTTVGIILVIGAFFLLSKEEYAWGVMLLLALLVLLKIDELSEWAFSLKDGFRAKFTPEPEKIEADIRENEEEVTPQSFTSFKHVEEKILSELQERYDAEMKTQIHFIFGEPDKPQFRYTPDGSLQTSDTLYLFEIKYALKPEFTESIINKAKAYLENVYKAFSPSAGKRLVIKLIIASSTDIDISKFTMPEGIELEFFKV